jgi:hypothetical protein
MNARAESNSPPDTVLLFETEEGWNQHGGPEKLYTGNHPNAKRDFWGRSVPGCNVLFSDGRIEFVRSKDFWRLRWGNTDREEESEETVGE